MRHCMTMKVFRQILKGIILMFNKNRLWCFLFITVFLISCTPSFLRPPETVMAPTDSKALVRFISPKAVGYVFDSEELIGYAFPGTQFDYLASPGKHLFIASLENKAFLEADLEPGKTYYVLMRRYEGFWRVRIAFLPVNKNSGLWDKAKAYEAKANKYDLDDEAKSKWQAKIGPKMPGIISHYENEVKHKYDWPRLNPEDGI